MKNLKEKLPSPSHSHSQSLHYQEVHYNLDDLLKRTDYVVNENNELIDVIKHLNLVNCKIELSIKKLKAEFQLFIIENGNDSHLQVNDIAASTIITRISDSDIDVDVDDDLKAVEVSPVDDNHEPADLALKSTIRNMMTDSSSSSNEVASGCQQPSIDRLIMEGWGRHSIYIRPKLERYDNIKITHCPKKG